eukprot:SAG11_NODE_7897_length_1083_cov_1.252033_2_plen_126_part_00
MQQKRHVNSLLQHGEFTVDDDDAEFGKRVMGSGGIGSSKRKRATLLASLGCLVIFAMLTSLRSVPPAHIGVITTFGRISEGVLESGLHITNPFAAVEYFTIKTQLFEQQNHVPTMEGLTVDLDVA